MPGLLPARQDNPVSAQTPPLPPGAAGYPPLTRKRQARWGQARLFADGAERSAGRYRVCDDEGRWGPPTASLPLAIAQARAAAAVSGAAVILRIDGTTAAVTASTDGFQIVALDPAGWPETVRRVLSRHG